MEAENVTDYTDTLKATLAPSIRVECLHGKMKAGAKNDIMERFADGQIDVLVSTTVIEVGINVPNATVMMVENAERFGLAQLHQLRGRVGRGSAQSYCIFMAGNSSQETMERLRIVRRVQRRLLCGRAGSEAAWSGRSVRNPAEWRAQFCIG